MSAGGSFNQPPQASGGTGNSPLTSDQPSEPVMRTADFQDSNGNGIDDRDEGQQRPMGPQVDRSFGFGRQFQQPSFINPFMGGYGFGQPFGGFGGGFGGLGSSFGMGLGSLFGGYSPMPFGGYQSFQPPQQQFNYGPPQPVGLSPIQGGTSIGQGKTFTGPNALIDAGRASAERDAASQGLTYDQYMAREAARTNWQFTKPFQPYTDPQGRQIAGGKPAPGMGGYDGLRRQQMMQQMMMQQGAANRANSPDPNTMLSDHGPDSLRYRNQYLQGPRSLSPLLGGVNQFQQPSSQYNALVGGGNPAFGMGGLGSFFGGGGFNQMGGYGGLQQQPQYQQAMMQQRMMQAQPFVETDDEINQRIAKRESDYYANLESIFGKEQADEIRKSMGPVNFAAGSTSRFTNTGGIG